MKYTEEKRQEIADWISENGLYPQRCGASIKQYCAAMGITKDTHFQWMKDKPDYPDLIKTANAVFAEKAVFAVTASLIKVAKGYQDVRMEEFGQYVKTDVPGADGSTVTIEKWKTVKAKKTTVNVAPNVAAAIFLLTNLDSENWKNRQDTNVAGEVKGLKIVVDGEETASDLREVIDLVNNED